MVFASPPGANGKKFKCATICRFSVVGSKTPPPDGRQLRAVPGIQTAAISRTGAPSRFRSRLLYRHIVARLAIGESPQLTLYGVISLPGYSVFVLYAGAFTRASAPDRILLRRYRYQQPRSKNGAYFCSDAACANPAKFCLLLPPS